MIPSGASRDQFLASYIRFGLRSSKGSLEELVKLAPEQGGNRRLVEVIDTLDKANFSELPGLLGQRQIPLAADVFDALVGKWAEKDAEAVAAFAVGVPEALQEKVDASIKRLMESSTASAVGVFERMPASPGKDARIAGLIRDSSKYAADQAWKLGLQVSDPQLQSELLTQIYDKWSLENKVAADAALAKVIDNQ
jgi:hypothetical protein